MNYYRHWIIIKMISVLYPYLWLHKSEHIKLYSQIGIYKIKEKEIFNELENFKNWLACCMNPMHIKKIPVVECKFWRVCNISL